MPDFTFEGPGGKQVTITGPPGSTREQAIEVLHQHLGTQNQAPETPGLLKSAASGLIQGAGQPGDLSKSVLGNAPPQQPVDSSTYYGKLVDTLNSLRQHLELPTTPQIGNAVGMQPTAPVTGVERAVQMGARAIPGMAMGGSMAGRAAMGAAPAANAVRGMGLAPQGPASPVGGAPAAQIPQVGNQAQAGLLRQVAGEALKKGSDFLPFPLNHAARFAGPKVLGLEQ